MSRKPSDDSTHRRQVSFSEATYDWLRATAYHRNVPMSQVVREALEEYRERHAPPQLGLPLDEPES